MSDEGLLFLPPSSPEAMVDEQSSRVRFVPAAPVAVALNARLSFCENQVDMVYWQ